MPTTGLTCPACGLAADPAGACPDCGQDLSSLAYLRARPILHYNDAVQRARGGDEPGAVRVLQLALAEDERFTDAWMLLGKLHARGGRTADARSAWQRVLGVEPGHAGATAALARLDETESAQAASDRRDAARRTRRRIGGWVLAAVLILLAALVTWLLTGSDPVAPPAARPSVLTVATRGGDVVLGGTVPDAAAQRAYADAATAGAGDRRVVDTTVLDPGSAAPAVDAGTVRSVVAALAGGPAGDRLVALGGPRVTLSGSLPDEDARAEALAPLRRALPGTDVVDQLAVGGGGTADAARINATLADIQDASPILFGPQDDPITAQGRATVALAAEYLGREPALRIRVEGYAARVGGGSPENAQRVSDARAAAVRDLLVDGGIDRDRIDAQGLGDRSPLDTPDASRRVVITVR